MGHVPMAKRCKLMASDALRRMYDWNNTMQWHSGVTRQQAPSYIINVHFRCIVRLETVGSAGPGVACEVGA